MKTPAAPVALVLAALISVLGVVPSFATVSEEPTDVATEPVEVDLLADGVVSSFEELGEGVCDDETLGVEEVTTCSFPLLTADRGIATGLALRDADSDDQASARCSVVGDQLVCADVDGGQQLGTRSFTLDLDPFDGRVVASVVVDRTTDGVLGLVETLGIQGSYLGASEVEVFRSFALPSGQAADMLLRRAGSDEVVVRVPALAAGEDGATVALPFTAGGRWTIAGCAVPEDATPGDLEAPCDAEGMRRPWQVIDPTPLPLVEGHNLAGSERISMVFYGSGWDGQTEALVRTARTLLALNGEPIPEVTSEGDRVLGWGPFSIEPLRGNAHRFNLWYLADDAPGDALQYRPATAENEDALGVDPSVLGLGEQVVMVNLDRDDLVATRSIAQDASFTKARTIPDADAMRFGSVHLPFPFLTPTDGATTFSHELGHALFGLRDEYVEPDVSNPTFGAPNCAVDTDDAAELWGDLLGQVDPMLTRWREAATAIDAWNEVGNGAPLVRVDYVRGGCFSEDEDVIRPTLDSLMSSGIPVFGMVNRRQVERVLERFEGTAVYDPDVHGASELMTRCDAEDATTVTCAVTVTAGLVLGQPVELRVNAAGGRVDGEDVPLGASLPCAADESDVDQEPDTESDTESNTESNEGEASEDDAILESFTAQIIRCPLVTFDPDAGGEIELLLAGVAQDTYTWGAPTPADDEPAIPVRQDQLQSMLIGGGSLLGLLALVLLMWRQRRYRQERMG